ncbi:MAG TPA: ABC transporter ATP-binding protein [Ktedonobacterales bacterium]|nr:ABC transporter ATP-binding protein [Ktedonobacterales bacterium]
MNNVGACAVRMRGVSRNFGSIRAVAGIDIEIRRGETVALLGPNGAGKTTTINMLLGLLAPSSGTVEVLGMSPAEAIRNSRIGAMLQEGKLLPGVQVSEFLDFVRSLHPTALASGDLIELAGLRGLERRRIDRLSGGQTQRVRFAMAIAGDPDLLVLDEPTAAMDVETRREFWGRMRAYAAQGHTVLFATHYLEEAETFASRLIVVAQGRVIADGTMRDIEERFGQPSVSFTVPVGQTSDFNRMPGVGRYETQDERVTLYTSDVDATVRALATSDLRWSDLEVRRVNLEETFVSMVREGAA